METLFVKLNEVVWDPTRKRWSDPRPKTIRMTDVLGWKPWECRDEDQASSTPGEFTRFNYVSHIYERDAKQQQKPSFIVVPMPMAMIDRMFESFVLTA